MDDMGMVTVTTDTTTDTILTTATTITMVTITTKDITITLTNQVHTTSNNTNFPHLQELCPTSLKPLI